MIIGTWNLENLYRPGSPFGPSDKAAYEAKLASLAATITAIDPAILGVQEVGDPEALEELVGMLDGEWHIKLSEFPDDRGIRVGFLSRLALSMGSDTADFPEPLRPVQGDDSGRQVTRMGRGVLTAAWLTRARWVTVAVCHLKSKLLTYPGGRFNPRDEGERARFGAYALSRRAAEAATVRSVVDGLLLGRRERLVVLGDFNDEVTAATTQILQGPPGSEIGTPGEKRPDKGDEMRLWNIAPMIPEAQRFSRIHRGRRELIDHIFVNHEALALTTRAGTGVPNAGSVPGATAVPDLPSIEDDPQARRDAAGSDHAPVWADVEF
ncbi:endonuclease/exonuclease/phosphatase family protein [Streptomyces sp. NBC_01304]|uniref:endonuclease/exonuclease/phosphatase family protein n=1 Tax=Streptomyces sp. NBC_01304 TaxID=2903818 RepID=UPI002E107BA4|nr:endonuclease/exonuclease/phosphatase family protein [Streptomyces sp. NBC_01304]